MTAHERWDGWAAESVNPLKTVGKAAGIGQKYEERQLP
jgi:hypothetical protein